MRWLLAPVMLLLSLATSGCGMMGLHGLAGMSHHNNYNRQNNAIIIKQFQQDGLRGELSAPVLVARESSFFRLLIDDENGPVSNATVNFSFESDQGQTLETIQVVGGQQGRYEVEYTPAAEGFLAVTSEIYGLTQSEGVSVRLQQNVIARQNGIWSGNTKFLLGGLGMGLMLLWMNGVSRH